LSTGNNLVEKMGARQPDKRWNASKGFYKILSEIPEKNAGLISQ